MNIYFLEVATSARVTYFGVASEVERDSWVKLIGQAACLSPEANNERLTSGVDILRRSSLNDANVDSMLTATVVSDVILEDETKDTDDHVRNIPSLSSFLNSPRWKDPARIILNCRRMAFVTPNKGGTTLEPLQVVSDLLTRSLSLNRASNSRDIISLMDQSAILKLLDVHSIANDNVSLCFWLNL